MLFVYNTSGRLLLHFRGFNLYDEKFLEFPVKPATLLTVGLFSQRETDSFVNYRHIKKNICAISA